MIGLSSFDLSIRADDGVVLKNVKGPSYSGFCSLVGNEYIWAANPSTGLFTGYFREELWPYAD